MDNYVYLAIALVLGYLVRELFQSAYDASRGEDFYAWQQINEVLSQEAFKAQRAWCKAGEPLDGPVADHMGNAISAYNDHLKRFPS